jgi:hypothetical protein
MPCVGKKSKTNTFSAATKNVKVGIRPVVKLKHAEKSARKVVATAEVDSAPAEIEAAYGGWSDEEEVDGEVGEVEKERAVAKSKKGKAPLGKVRVFFDLSPHITLPSRSSVHRKS